MELLRSKADILILVEDPGAANYVLRLPEIFVDVGLSCRVLATGHAIEFLRDRQVEFDELATEKDTWKVLNQYAPTLLLAGTSQNLDSPVLKIIDEARALSVCTIGIVDMAADAYLRFCGRSSEALKHVPDWLLVTDKATKREFVKLGFPSKRINICGHPSFDRVDSRNLELAGMNRVEMRKNLLGLDPDPRPVWMFVAEHGNDDSRMQRSPSYTLHGRGDSDRRADIVLEEVLDAALAFNPCPFVVLRLHPKNKCMEFSAYMSEVDLVSTSGDPLDFIWVSDLVIGMSSILLSESAWMNRPTLSILPREKEIEWSHCFQNGLVPYVTNRDQLIDALSNFPKIDSCITKTKNVENLKVSILKIFNSVENVF